MPLDSEGMKLSVRSGRFAIPGVQAECVLPARCLRRLHVVFDYPARQLTVARPGVLTPVGTAVPCRVNPETGLFLVEATIDGDKVALGVDTGSAGTWLSDKLTAAWLARHPDRPRAVGAAGSTNFFGFPFETEGALISLPALAIGPVPVAGEVAVLGLDQGLFDWYSKKSAAPVAGFVGADLIARFRLEIDFPGQMTWWQSGTASICPRPGHRRPDPARRERRFVQRGRRGAARRPAAGRRRRTRRQAAESGRPRGQRSAHGKRDRRPARQTGRHANPAARKGGQASACGSGGQSPALNPVRGNENRC